MPRLHPRRIAFLTAVVLNSPLIAADPAPTAEPEVVLHKWSGDLNVPDPVSCAVDPQGRVYVTATTRRKVGDLDIREHPMWIPDDVALDSVEAKRAFYHEQLAPGRLTRPRGSLDDHNADGSIDWRDLTVHTERIYQLRDENGDGTADRMTVFAEGFNTEVTGIAAGVLWHDGWVYATIAPDLWRLKDVDDDGVADIREKVVSGFGLHIAYAGHDMHGLNVGPDGRIYWSIGDKGSNVLSREGKRFYYPNQGAMFRIEPDGSGFEVYAHGLRNPQEPAFDTWGDWFVVDNDADMEGERERFVHIVEGSDSGWRCNYQYMGLAAPWMREGLWQPHFPGQAAYLLPPRSNYSDGPAGFRFEPGTALGPAQRHHFILTEFPSGRLRGFEVEPEVASYRMTNERDLHRGVMGIGLSWHPNGALMMVDWIGGYPLDQLGAIWRIDSSTRDDAQRRETEQLLRSGFGQRDDDGLLDLLGYADQRVRLGAQFELARRERTDALLRLASDESAAPLSRVHALWGYGQLLRRGDAGAEPLRALLANADAELRRQTARVLGDSAPVRALAADLIALLDDNSPRVVLQAALALGKWATPEAAEPLLKLAERAGEDPVLRHAAATGLTGCASDDLLAAQVNHPSVPVRLASVVALRRRHAQVVDRYLADDHEWVVAEAARAIHDDTSIPAALPALARLLDTRPTNDVVLRRALNANLRLGDVDGARRLLDYALDSSSTAAFRQEALSILREWPSPPRLDRVDGRARTIRTVSIASVLTPALDRLLALNDSALKTLAVEILLAHQLEPTAAQVAQIVEDSAAPAALRAQALRLLIQQHPRSPELAEALQRALADDAEEPIFAVAVAHLRQHDGDRFVAVARQALQQRSVPVQQDLVQGLAELATPAADAVLVELGQALAKGELSPPLQLDVLNALAVRANAHAGLAELHQAYQRSSAAKQRQELLAGGDVSSGREIALNHLGANCLACHRIEADQGSAVGPSLHDVGARLDAAGVLRALVEPNAELAPGYGLVAVTLKSGDVSSGGLWRETPESVVLRRLDGGEQVIPRADIADLSTPVSMMPPMDSILEPGQLRDLIAYLGTLKPKARK